MTLEKQGKQLEKQSGDTTAAGPSPLQSEGWMLNRQPETKREAEAVPKQEAKPDNVAQDDKSKDPVVVKGARDLRNQYGLDKDASSSKVYQAMAHESVELFGSLTAKEKTEGLSSLRLTPADMKDERKIYNALIARDRRDGGLPPMTPEELKADKGVGIRQAEQALHISAHEYAKKHGIPIDYN
mgnify:CR=1 FL=1